MIVVIRINILSNPDINRGLHTPTALRGNWMNVLRKEFHLNSPQSPHFTPGIKELSCLRVAIEIVFWIFDTFYNNLKITNNLTNYLKRSCW